MAMVRYVKLGRCAVLLACVPLFQAPSLSAAQVTVNHTEGMVHGFLVLRTLDGNTIAEGDLIQIARGDRVTAHLTFHFKDGSVYEESSVFSQNGSFRLLSDHLLRKGPTFKRPMEVSIDGSTGEVAVHYTDDDGKEKIVTDSLKLPSDVANGILFTLLKNIKPDALQTTVSMVATTPKPRLVKLLITPHGEEPFSIGGSARKATHMSSKRKSAV